MISINSLTYRYPNSADSALNNISLAVAPGEFIVLAGESGSGKTTLLRSINGLVPHFSGGEIEGQVSVNSIDVITAGPQRLSRIIGFVNQNPESQAILEIVEPEIAFALENAALPADEMRVRVEEALDLMDLTSLRQRPINTLSGGEKQRVAIASVLAFRPQVLLLDEPTSQLDPKSAEDVLRALVRLNEDLGLTIIIAEHRLERVLRYADRLIYMNAGQILADGDVHLAVSVIPQLPPLLQLGRELGWSPLPLTVKEGRKLVAQFRDILADKSPKNIKNKKNSPPPGQVVLSAQNVVFSYNGTPVLHGIDLQVRSGEVLALMGRNGSGKSTFLKCIIGLLRVTKGTIKINDVSVNGLEIAEIAKKVAYLPQNPDDLLFAETVFEELETTLVNHKMKNGDSIQKLLDELGLSEEINSYPRDLSTGQRQRVALGAVTITQPDLLLLDEPTRGLDSQTKTNMLEIWQQWLAKGAAIIVVTHDVELAAKIADRVAVLSQGEIITSGPPREVLGNSPLFAPQISRLFPDRGWLTVDDALSGLNYNENL